MTDISDMRYISHLVDTSVRYDDVDTAIALMEHLRKQAQILDRHLADPRHHWNRVREELLDTGSTNV